MCDKTQYGKYCTVQHMPTQILARNVEETVVQIWKTELYFDERWALGDTGNI